MPARMPRNHDLKLPMPPQSLKSIQAGLLLIIITQIRALYLCSK